MAKRLFNFVKDHNYIHEIHKHNFSYFDIIANI